MGTIVFLFSRLGLWLDQKCINKNDIYLKVLTMVGVALAFYNVSRQLKEINKSDEEK